MMRNRGLNTKQIRLAQAAARGAGLRTKDSDGRYRLVLAQYKQPSGREVTSCKQLTREQFDDFLSICRSMGWQDKSTTPHSYRQGNKQHRRDGASDAQLEAIKQLAGNLGFTQDQYPAMVKGFTRGRADSLATLTDATASSLIEALKAKLTRTRQKPYSSLQDVANDMNERNATDGTADEADIHRHQLG